MGAATRLNLPPPAGKERAMIREMTRPDRTAPMDTGNRRLQADARVLDRAPGARGKRAGASDPRRVPGTTALFAEVDDEYSSETPRSWSPAGDRSNRRSRRRTILVVAVVLGLIAALGLGWRWWTIVRYIETTDDAYVQADITAVSSRVEGYVRKVYVTDNQQVRVGDVLATVDNREFVARVEQTLEQVQAQRAVIAGVDKRIARQRAVIDQATAALDAATAAQQQTQQDLIRYQVLVRRDVASRQRLEASQADAEQAVAGVQKARAQILAEKSELAALEAERQRDEALLEAAEATQEIARIDLADTELRAPVEGIVGNRTVQVGQLLRPGAQLLSIVPTSGAYVVANFKETQLARMHVGQKVEIEADAYPGQKVEGTIASFSPAVGSLFSLLPPENASGNFTKVVQRLPLRIDLPPSGPLTRLLRAGLSVTASVDTRPEGEAQGTEGMVSSVIAPLRTFISR
jgi:membrane fusion protein (multidrug efflux system)